MIPKISVQHRSHLPLNVGFFSSSKYPLFDMVEKPVGSHSRRTFWWNNFTASSESLPALPILKVLFFPPEFIKEGGEEACWSNSKSVLWYHLLGLEPFSAAEWKGSNTTRLSCMYALWVFASTFSFLILFASFVYVTPLHPLEAAETMWPCNLK